MKTMINLDERRFAMVEYDGDNLTAQKIETAPERIGTLTIVPEDCTLQYTTSDNTVIHKDVKKDDIIVYFYSREMGVPFIIVKSEDWINAINNYYAEQQRQKEEWAKNAVCKDCASTSCNKEYVK